MCVCVCVCVHVYVCMCMYVCVFVQVKVRINKPNHLAFVTYLSSLWKTKCCWHSHQSFYKSRLKHLQLFRTLPTLAPSPWQKPLKACYNKCPSHLDTVNLPLQKLGSWKTGVVEWHSTGKRVGESQSPWRTHSNYSVYARSATWGQCSGYSVPPWSWNHGNRSLWHLHTFPDLKDCWEFCEKKHVECAAYHWQYIRPVCVCVCVCVSLEIWCTSIIL